MLAIYSVSEISRYIKQVIESDDFLQGIWVKGEISNFVLHSSGHMYFSLKDQSSRIRCVMFRSHNFRLKFIPSDGMSIFAYGAIGIYERSGDIQLYVEDIMPSGTGSLYLAFLQLKEKLEKEGLFSLNMKKSIPSFPKVVAVITSPTGAAVQDVITVIRRRNPSVSILVVPTLVQGEDAPESIVKAIELVNRAEFIDVAILGRGGGSIEELMAFNDEKVARAIAASTVPVISAVGHETDFTIADFVADIRAATPSAAAEIAVPNTKELETGLSQLDLRLTNSIQAIISSAKTNLDSKMRSHVLRFPMELTRDYSIKLSVSSERMYNLINNLLIKKREDYRVLTGLLKGLSPSQILSRGYGFIRKLTDKSIVSGVDQVAPSDNLEIILKDGSFTATVDSVVNRRKR